jgi:RNA polymerase sigma-70 factor (ECF subfamily)
VTTDEQQWLAERFEEQRPSLRAVAYRMLGSLSERTTPSRTRGCA